jgi:CBS domain-containing protein
MKNHATKRDELKVEALMTRRVVAARADTDLAHVARLMWDNDCGSVPIVDAEDRVVGMLTDRDLCMGAQFAGRALREVRAGASMASDLLTCAPEEPVLAVVRRMGERKVRRVPVTDAAGRLVGIVSIGDLLGAAGRAGPSQRKVLGEALLAALTAITARPRAEEVAPLPSRRKAPIERGANAAAKATQRRSKV